jgi:polysaccharide deacetylase family sporulation protein PdaB
MYKALREGSFLKKLLGKIKNRKAAASAVALVLLTAVIFWTTNSPAVVGVSASDRQLPIYCVRRDDKTVALSFDAAWGNEDTQELIDILNKYNIHATFFVVGQWADKYPESVKALSDAGNEVMSHSDDHAHFAQLTAEEIRSNISASNEKIKKITGTEPTLFRCPYGEYNDTVISTVNSMGMSAIQWDVDSLDWKGISAGDISDRVLKNVKSGSIVLFHNAAENTPEALPGIIEGLIADGYKIVPVSQILLTGDYTIDNTGMQCQAKANSNANADA